MKTLFLLILALALPLQAQQMNYQGRLTDAFGNARPGPQSTITFSLWTAAAAGAGNRVWGPFSTNVDLIDGRFSTKLGDPTGGDNQNPERVLNQVFTEPLFLEMTVGTDAAALPRQEILPSPAAFYAEKANHSVTADTAANFTSLVLKTDETNQRVGIGTSTPGKKLDVNGDVRGSFIVRQNGSYENGSIYSDLNYGMLFRSAEPSPARAAFSFANTADQRLKGPSKGTVLLLRKSLLLGFWNA
jgi:hypothetical protein